MLEIAPFVGGIAALLASLSYIPQVRKAWPRNSTGDLSLGMLSALTLGLTLWVAYGLLRADWIVVAANVVGASLAGIVLGCKIRDGWRSDRRSAPAQAPGTSTNVSASALRQVRSEDVSRLDAVDTP